MYKGITMEKEIIRLENASVRFNLAAQKRMGLKEYIASALQGRLLFQEFIALKNISLSVNQGESWGIIGKNGSGKSTLLKVITGILRPYQGRVVVKGKVAPLLELGAGFDPELTGRENIMMNGLILGLSKAEINERFDDIVSFAELENFLDVPIKNYSSGMKSRLGFSIATSYVPDILIADEVLATGDRAFQEKCEERMSKLLAAGTTLLYVSHSPGAIQKMCSKTIWLDNGQIRMIGDTLEVMDAYNASLKQN